MDDEGIEKTDKIYVGAIQQFNTALAMEGYKKNHNCCDSITICIQTICPRPLCGKKNILTIFDQLKGLEPYQKDIFRIRYYPLFKNYQSRCFFYALIFHSSRFIVTVGSITVPALLALQSTTDRHITWIVWTISLAVTIFNGILTLFKIDKKYYFLHTTKELLESEGWQYIALTGKYSKLRDSENIPNSHETQFTQFCLAIERIKMRQVEEEYYKAQETNTGTSSPNSSQPKTAAAPQAQQPPIMNDMYNSSLLKGSSASPSNQTEEMKQWVNSIVDPALGASANRNRQHLVTLQRQIDELKASIEP